MKVPHTITFEAIIDLDKVPASIIKQLLSKDETFIKEMCTGATLNAIEMSELLKLANDGNSWAELTIKDGE